MHILNVGLLDLYQTMRILNVGVLDFYRNMRILNVGLLDLYQSRTGGGGYPQARLRQVTFMKGRVS